MRVKHFFLIFGFSFPFFEKKQGREVVAVGNCNLPCADTISCFKTLLGALYVWRSDGTFGAGEAIQTPGSLIYRSILNKSKSSLGVSPRSCGPRQEQPSTWVLVEWTLFALWLGLLVLCRFIVRLLVKWAVAKYASPCVMRNTYLKMVSTLRSRFMNGIYLKNSKLLHQLGYRKRKRNRWANGIGRLGSLSFSLPLKSSSGI